MNIKQLLIFILLIGCLSLPASAGPTGLIVIPTAEVREQGTYEIEYQSDGRDGFAADAHASFLNTQFGLLDRLEAGLDFKLSGDIETDVFLNAKYGFPVSGTDGAIGVYNIGNQSKSIPYVVVSRAFGRVGLTAGAQRFNDETQSILGLAYETGRFLFSADYTSGSENFSSLGFEYSLSDSFAVQWGKLFPNDDGADESYTLHLIFNSRFR